MNRGPRPANCLQGVKALGGGEVEIILLSSKSFCTLAHIMQNIFFDPVRVPPQDGVP